MIALGLWADELAFGELVWETFMVSRRDTDRVRRESSDERESRTIARTSDQQGGKQKQGD